VPAVEGQARHEARWVVYRLQSIESKATPHYAPALPNTTRFTECSADKGSQPRRYFVPSLPNRISSSKWSQETRSEFCVGPVWSGPEPAIRRKHIFFYDIEEYLNYLNGALSTFSKIEKLFFTSQKRGTGSNGSLSVSGRRDVGEIGKRYHEGAWN